MRSEAGAVVTSITSSKVEDVEAHAVDLNEAQPEESEIPRVASAGGVPASSVVSVIYSLSKSHSFGAVHERTTWQYNSLHDTLFSLSDLCSVACPCTEYVILRRTQVPKEDFTASVLGFGCCGSSACLSVYMMAMGILMRMSSPLLAKLQTPTAHFTLCHCMGHSTGELQLVPVFT